MKKLLSLVLALVMVMSMTVAMAETVTLKVWGAQEDQALLGELVEGFKAANPDTTWDISLGVVGEPDAKTRYLEDPVAAADVFAFANDQLRDLVNADALYEVTRNKDAIAAANSAGSVESATLNDTLYGYPMTADNGYFLYYDKSVLTEEDVKTLDGILAAAVRYGETLRQHQKEVEQIHERWRARSEELTRLTKEGKELLEILGAFSPETKSADGAKQAIRAAQQQIREAEKVLEKEAAAERRLHDLREICGETEAAEQPVEDFSDRYTQEEANRQLEAVRSEIAQRNAELAANAARVESLGDPAELAAERDALTDR
ncbi:MAG: extracellular solute-binding protein, partial [Clostridia bacterium]|nr:extracellular solute-binding protein [Clostridia bacterium]